MDTATSSFRLLPSNACEELISSDGKFPSVLRCLHSKTSRTIILPNEGTHYGYLHSGIATLGMTAGPSQGYRMDGGMYFSVAGEAELRIEAAHTDAVGFVATRQHADTDRVRGFFQLGGPVEDRGRLAYIDGCSDSLLISPVVLGAACLNLLFLPRDTRQTSHTHPSCRMGMIISGGGVCKTPEADHALVPGMKFLIEPEAEHSFHTTDQSLRVIAWHPDSDFGPANNDHPMINRTIIDGVSAAILRKDGERVR